MGLFRGGDIDEEALLVHGAVRLGREFDDGVQRHVKGRNLVLGNVHEVPVEDTEDGLVADNADTLPLSATGAVGGKGGGEREGEGRGPIIGAGQ